MTQPRGVPFDGFLAAVTGRNDLLEGFVCHATTLPGSVNVALALQHLIEAASIVLPNG